IFANLDKVFWYDFFGPLIGFSYQVWNALYASIAVIAIGCFIFQKGKNCALITPTKPEEKHENSYPKFDALIYSLETFVPLARFGIAEFWTPSATSGKEVPGLRELILRAAILLWPWAKEKESLFSKLNGKLKIPR